MQGGEGCRDIVHVLRGGVGREGTKEGGEGFRNFKFLLKLIYGRQYYG